MIIQISGPVVEILEIENLTRMHVKSNEAPGTIEAALRTSGLGYLDGENRAVLDVDVLLSRCGQQTTYWENQWASMIEFASEKGWTRNEGRSVVAHIESE